jgi:hypothetical protein
MVAESPVPSQAVAFPAAPAYNIVSRQNRLLGGKRDTFAHDLFLLLTTGPTKEPEQLKRLLADWMQEASKSRWLKSTQE